MLDSVLVHQKLPKSREGDSDHSAGTMEFSKYFNPTHISDDWQLEPKRFAVANNEYQLNTRETSSCNMMAFPCTNSPGILGRQNSALYCPVRNRAEDFPPRGVLNAKHCNEIFCGDSDRCLPITGLPHATEKMPLRTRTR